MDAMWLVRFLEPLPKTASFERHLLDCATYEMIRAEKGLPPLTVWNVLFVNPMDAQRNAPMARDD